MTEQTIRDAAVSGPSATSGLVQEERVMTCRRLLDSIFRDYGPRDFVIRFWDGTELPATAQRGSDFALVIRNPSALRAMLREPVERSLAEAYIDELIDIEGDLGAAFPIAEYLSTRTIGWWGRVQAAIALRSLPVPDTTRSRPASLRGRIGSRQRTQDAVRFHYDQPPEFWQLWLDPAMVYSGAFFENANDSLEAAQQAKLEKVCRKLRLEPGQKLLDMGCGWGGLLIHAATHYGVHAHGITLSQKQAEYATKRVHELGLGDRCKIEVRDLRSLDGGGMYDGVASMGAVEHVPEADLPAYFQCAWRALRPGGRFLSQGITRAVRFAGRPHSPFMQEYVFPDSNLMPLERIISVAERAGFVTRHVEAMTEHYARTTRLWYDRLGARRSEAVAIVGMPTYRTFRLMLLGSSHNFATGSMGLYQVLFWEG